MKRAIELLAPARDADVAIDAIKAGADAVYIGAVGYGARAAACNSVEDIARVTGFAHKFNARVYVTLNTIIYDSEIAHVERLITELYEVGVDALIVQDMGVLRMKIPPIALHASTQCDTRGVEKARFLQQVGFSQIVLARELSLTEISAIHKAVDVPLEAFVHGALCVSYSGDCQASCVAMGRSANRGECAQMCRLPYRLTDGAGRCLVDNKHLLSLRDMNRSSDIQAMIEAGVSSFKIEGRLKDAGYVKNIVAYYRKKIDDVIRSNPDKYCRLSTGQSQCGFEPDPAKSFNRRFTTYFLHGREDKIASIDTPKSRGERVGTVKMVKGGTIVVNFEKQLNNGDGIVYFDTKGEFKGFRLNKINGDSLYPASPVNIEQRTVLYRNYDKKWCDIIESARLDRCIEVLMKLERRSNGITLSVSDERGNKVELSVGDELQLSHTPQQESRKRVLTKTGNTIYRVTHLTDNLEGYFIPASKLTELRRNVLAMLDERQRLDYKRDERRKEDKQALLPQGEKLSYHDNVANCLAEEFYREHGAKTIEKALEITGVKDGETVVMTTKYCLRREMGYCLKTSRGREWKAPLYLQSANNRFRLDFDCVNCHMRVIYLNSKQY